MEGWGERFTAVAVWGVRYGPRKGKSGVDDSEKGGTK